MSDSAGQSRAWTGGSPGAGIGYSPELTSAPQWQRARPPCPDFLSGVPASTSYTTANNDRQYNYNSAPVNADYRNDKSVNYNRNYTPRNDRRAFNQDKYTRDRSRSKSKNRGNYSTQTSRREEKQPTSYSKDRKSRRYQRSSSGSSDDGKRSRSSSPGARGSSRTSAHSYSYSPKRRQSRSRSKSNDSKVNCKDDFDIRDQSNYSRRKTHETNKLNTSNEDISSRKNSNRQYERDSRRSRSRSRSNSRDGFYKYSRKYSSRARSSSKERSYSKKYDSKSMVDRRPRYSNNRYDKHDNYRRRNASESGSKDNKYNDAGSTDNSDEDIDGYSFDESSYSQMKDRSKMGIGTPPVPTVTPFKNDGSFLEMFKKMQESQSPAECASTSSTSVPAQSAEIKKPALPFIGKRRGGRLLKTGIVKKVKTIEEHTVDEAPKDAWSLYLQEVKKYRESSCEEEGKTRPLVK